MNNRRTRLLAAVICLAPALLAACLASGSRALHADTEPAASVSATDPASPRALRASWPAADRAMAGERAVFRGTLTLSADPAPAVKDSPGPESITVPAGTGRPVMDGVLGDDWDDALGFRQELRDGEALLLGTKHFRGRLYVSLAVPSDRALVAGGRAEIQFLVPSADGTTRDVGYRLRVEQDGTVTPFIDAGTGFGWRPVTPESAFEGAASGDGDGATPYPVFEFGIPLRDLDASLENPDILLRAQVSLPRVSSMRHAGVRRDQYVIRWPRGGFSFSQPQLQSFEARPDAWGMGVLADRAVGERRMGATRLAQAPAVDGHLSAAEWDGADRHTIELEPGATHTLKLARCDDYLYVASVWRVPPGTSYDQALHLHVDCLGDGGLVPRRDDRRFSMAAEGPRLRMEATLWDNEKGMGWSVPAGIPFRAATGSFPHAEGVENVLEVALPLSALGLKGKTEGTEFGLGVETAVDAVTPPGHRVTPPAQPRRPAAPGEGPASPLPWPRWTR